MSSRLATYLLFDPRLSRFFTPEQKLWLGDRLPDFQRLSARPRGKRANWLREHTALFCSTFEISEEDMDLVSKVSEDFLRKGRELTYEKARRALV